MKNLKRIAAAFVVVLSAGCAPTKLTAPAPGAVQGGISRVQAGATTAEQQRKEIEQLNQEARNKQQRVDNKDMVIDAYRKWKAGQKP